MNTKNFWIKLAIALVCLGIVGCSGNDDEEENTNNSVSNSTGNSINVQLRNGVWFGIGKEHDGRIRLDNGKFETEAYTFGYEVNDTDIASVGAVSGLSSIKIIPGSGWSKSVKAEKGYGYIVRIHQNHWGNDYGYEYFRLYVKDFIKDTTGTILAAIVVWEWLNFT